MATPRDVSEVLRRHQLRVTPQRRAILEAFRGSPDEHLSAEEVLSRASLTVPEIGRGTVYAALAELTELGLMASVGHAEAVRYETNLEPHDHFNCRLCMRLYDVDLGGEPPPDPPEGYRIESVTIRAEGVCAGCREYLRGLGDGARAARDHPTLGADMLKELSCDVVDSPVGSLAFAASGDGIVHVAFADHADFDPIARRAGTRRAGAADPRLQGFGAAVQRYFAGSHAALTDSVDWRPIAPVTAETLRQVWEIPFGESRSYESVCSHLGAYDCGVAMGSNPLPLLIPCHRVSCGPSRPDLYVGGAERLHFLHRLERQ